jgi:hypothetical protein
MQASGAIRHIIDEVHISLAGGVDAEAGDRETSLGPSTADPRGQAAPRAIQF